MLKNALLAVVVLTSSAVASAETLDGVSSNSPPSGTFVDVDLQVGFMRDWRGGFLVEGGRQLGATPLFAHAALGGGDSGGEGTSYVQGRAGLEARTCTRSQLLCSFGALDVGYQHAATYRTVSDTMDEFIEAHDLLLVPRVGAEVGGRMRLRLAIELPMFLRVDERETGHGVMYSAGVGYTF